MTTVTDRTLEALLVLDRIATQYARRAGDTYQQGFGSMRKTESLRRGALYRLKSYILATLYMAGDVEAVDRHHIEDSEFYCAHIGEYSFHSPVSKFEAYLHHSYARQKQGARFPPDPTSVPALSEIAASIGGPALPETSDSTRVSERLAITAASTPFRHPEDFTASETTPDELMDERDALWHLAEEYKSVNEFLYPFTDGKPVGWSFLPDYVEEGDDMSESELRDTSHKTFLFAVGDTVETVERGRIEITNRYGRWLADRRYRDPIIPRPVYDILVCETGERRTGVRTERILEDWRIHVEDPSNPLPDVDGPLAEQVGSYDLDFEPGDVLTLDRGFDDGPVDWQVDRIGIHSSRLEVSLGPPEEDWAEPLPPEEFVEDILDITRAEQ